DLPGRYADPDLAATATPAKIDAAMLRQCARMLAGIQWSDADVARFLGCWLSEPKPHVFFDPPAPALAPAAFRARAARRGLRLDRRTQLLYDGRNVFINGIAQRWPADGTAMIRRLANRRALTGRELAAVPPRAAALLFDWYRDGYLQPAG